MKSEWTEETGIPQVDVILADEYAMGSDYRIHRTKGTRDWLLIFTTSGCGLVRMGAGFYRLPPGSAVLFRPGVKHDYGTDPKAGSWGLLWAHFEPSPAWRVWLESWPQVSSGVAVQSFGSTAEDMAAALRRTVRARRRTVPGAIEFARNALEEALLWANAARSEGPWATMDYRVRRAMDYLTERVDRPFVMSELARHCGLSASRLSHCFKKQTGETPQRFSEAVRMERARHLLEGTQATVSEVAAACGYDDPFYFSRRFVRALGRSPTAWRSRREHRLGGVLQSPGA